jgi:hypothetical protein
MPRWDDWNRWQYATVSICRVHSPTKMRLMSSVLICRIFQIPKLGEKLKQESLPLSFTPRQFITHPTNKLFYLVEADHRTLGPDAARKRLADIASTHATYDCFLLMLLFLTGCRWRGDRRGDRQSSCGSIRLSQGRVWPVGIVSTDYRSSPGMSVLRTSCSSRHLGITSLTAARFSGHHYLLST